MVGLVLFWFGSVISAFGSGLSARERLISFLGPGSAPWAVGVLIAVALLVLGSSRDQAGTPVVALLYQVLLVAAAAIALASVVNAIANLTFFGNSVDFALYNFFQYLAGAPIAGAAGLWAWRAGPGIMGSKSKGA